MDREGDDCPPRFSRRLSGKSHLSDRLGDAPREVLDRLGDYESESYEPAIVGLGKECCPCDGLDGHAEQVQSKGDYDDWPLL